MAGLGLRRDFLNIEETMKYLESDVNTLFQTAARGELPLYGYFRNYEIKEGVYSNELSSVKNISDEPDIDGVNTEEIVIINDIDSKSKEVKWYGGGGYLLRCSETIKELPLSLNFTDPNQLAIFKCDISSYKTNKEEKKLLIINEDYTVEANSGMSKKKICFKRPIKHECVIKLKLKFHFDEYHEYDKQNVGFERLRVEDVYDLTYGVRVSVKYLFVENNKICDGKKQAHDNGEKVSFKCLNSSADFCIINRENDSEGQFHDVYDERLVFKYSDVEKLKKLSGQEDQSLISIMHEFSLEKNFKYLPAELRAALYVFYEYWYKLPVDMQRASKKTIQDDIAKRYFKSENPKKSKLDRVYTLSAQENTPPGPSLSEKQQFKKYSERKSRSEVLC